MSAFLRRLNLILTCTAVVALVGVYAQKHMAERSAGEVARIEQAIAQQQADLSILKADWSLLNQPTHIQPIVDRHNDVLNLQVAQASQFGRFEDLPMRPEMRLDTDALNALFQEIEEGNDPIAALLEDIL
ncbi:cell division protein FtsL [Pelagibacterium montanilacus]|uniref:cell division protein FtsL n=1 Tax=Pelagibacterium montanilacus TaxID=2185280 RepID=UPI000F8CCE27|nr:hypothetical protein [Pelagibacterium montanilacus]